MKDIEKLLKGITTSKQKKDVLLQRILVFLDGFKKAWYEKLLSKLLEIRDGKLDLDDYIEIVKHKIQLHSKK